MVRGGCANSRPFRRRLERWRAVGGGIDSSGEILEEPWELTKARYIDGLCQRYSCLPSQLLEEDADLLLGIQTVLMLAGEHETRGAEPSMEDSLANMSRGI